MKVGTRVGETVGALLGDAVGAGEGAAIDVKVSAIDVTPVPGALLTVTTLEVESIETTTVKSARYRPVTVLPT